MIEAFQLIETFRFFILIMISFAFFVGIMLLVSQEAFDAFSRDLQKEYGVKKRFFPKIENSQYNFIDFVVLKYRFMAGIIISIAAFILLLLYK
jgi:ABC-type phosphate transport system permease subunit